MPAWPRLLTALVTPFTDDGRELDVARLEGLIAHVLGSGTEGLVIGGTTGESPTLSIEEFSQLLRETRRIVGRTVPVMAGVGTNSTNGTLAKALAAEASGADSLLVVNPYYNKPPQRGLIAHFTAVAHATELPVMLYNIPGRTSVNLLPESVATLAATCPTIKGIKEACGDLAQIRRVRELVERPDFDVWSGDDSLTAAVMALGGVGVVSVIAHVAGPAMFDLIETAAAGNTTEAEARQADLTPLIDAAFFMTNPIPIKAMLNHLGVPVGPVRLPLVEANEQELAIILQPFRA